MNTQTETAVGRLFGTVDDAAQAQIKTLSLENLEELGVALFDFKSPEDLTSWLRNHIGDEPPADQFVS